MNVNQKAVKVLNKIFEAGFTDEKAISAMTMDDILSMQGITVADITIINDLQKSIKANKVISFWAVVQMSKQIICFKDSEDKVVAAVPDGGVLRLFSENGDTQCVLCRYVDESRAEIDGVVYDTKDFIQKMEQNKIGYAPA
mgnify:CR=1 FL=1